MIEIQEARLLMAGRAGVFGILAEVMKHEPDLETVENLCKYMDDFFESLEFKGNKDETVEAYEKLSGWHSVALSINNKPFIEGKLAHEFALLFQIDHNAIDRVFPNTEGVGDFYNSYKYETEDNFGEIGTMLDFMAELAQRSASFDDTQKIKESAAVQKQFEKTFIEPYISNFCQDVYNKAPNYGIYQFIIIILHGFINIDVAVLDALDKNL